MSLCCQHISSLFTQKCWTGPKQHWELTCLAAVISTRDETHRLGGAHRFTFLGDKPIEKLVKRSAKNTFSQLCDCPEVGESPLVRRINLYRGPRQRS